MNPATDPIYAGIAGIRIGTERVDLGHGVVLQRTFAHLMAPFLMAFAPAEKGKAHPGPWSAVHGGLASDIHIQLFVPQTFQRKRFFDRLNTVWWLVALIRLRGGTRAHVPVISDRPFAELPAEWQHSDIVPVEVLPRHLDTDGALEELSAGDLQWLKDVWLPGAELMHSSSQFNDAFQALDSAGALPNRAVALLAAWGALEHLFSPSKQELRFRVSANLASYLEPPGPSRLLLHKQIMSLYDARSSVAHGTRLSATDAWAATQSLGRRVLLRILGDRRVPSKADLEAALFTPGI